MNLAYLEHEDISEEILNLRETKTFVDATKEAYKRDRDHPDFLNERFEYVTSPKNLQMIIKGWKIFQKHKDERANFLKEMEQTIPIHKEVFRKIGCCLTMMNNHTPTEALVLYGWPVIEMKHRIADTLWMNLRLAPKKIIISWGVTSMSQEVGFPNEAEYIEHELRRQWVERKILLEKEAKNTWDNAFLISPLLWEIKKITVITTSYDALRVALTNQAQTNFEGTKRVHGSSFVEDYKLLWSPNNWWETEIWWKATLYTITRLVKYRAKENPFL